MSMDYAEQYDKIYRYCYFKLHHRETAEDVTQETFLRFLNHQASYGKGDSLKLLYTIARNLCTDEYRRKKAELLSENQQEQIGISIPGPEEEYINKSLLHAALQKLSEEDRELILLRYVNEVPLMSLASLYHMSRFALYRRCQKLLIFLKKEVEG